MKTTFKTIVSIMLIVMLFLITGCKQKECNHNWIEATCTSPKTCTLCNKTEGTKLEHNYESLIIKPTCTEQGFAIYSCKECKHTYIDDYVKALDHDLIHHNELNPTCEEAGYKEYDTCSRCNYTTYEEVKKIGHNYSNPVFTWTDFTAAATFTCTNDETHIETINAVISSELIIDPTCTATGVKTHTATVIFNNKTYTDIKEEVLPVLEHTYTKETVSATTLKDEATCTTKATYWYSCTECDDISDTLYFENGNELGHDYSNPVFKWNSYDAVLTTFTCSYNSNHTKRINATITSEETKIPTCTATGIKTHTATVSFNNNTYTDTKEETIPMIDHNYVDGKCTVCNEEEPKYIKDGEYIYFGTYPQSEVTDINITTKLNTLSGTLPTSTNNNNWTSYGYYIEGNISNYMWYQDIEYNNEKYRGVYFTSYRPYYTDYSSSTDNSYQDNNGYNTNNIYWFKYEPIKWRILTEENNKALLLCEMIIDSQEYYNTSNNRTINGETIYANNYEYSTIRKWLNDNFYNTAFNELQKEIIELTLVDNSASTTGNTTNKYACNNTNDNIFLLSKQDVINSSYGFNTNDFASDPTRQKKLTEYAMCQGASASYYVNGYWWLRSPSDYNSYNARHVGNYGNADDYRYVYNAYDGVCPALWITL